MTELNTKVSNSLSYKGDVSVLLNTKGHKRPLFMHNAGTKHLFDTITRALAGYSINGATPRYVDIQHTLVSDVYITALTSLIPFVGTVYGEAAEAGADEGVLLLNATITADDKQPVTALHKPRLAILDANKQPLAVITGDDQLKSLWDSITDATDAIVEWKLIFSN